MKRWLLPALMAFALTAAGGALATASTTTGNHHGGQQVTTCDRSHGKTSGSDSGRWARRGWKSAHCETTTTTGSTTTTTGSKTTTSVGSHVCGLDVEWLTTSLKGDLFEIRGGRQALQKSQSSVVRQLAQKLIADHTKSFQDGAALAQSLGIKVPDSPTPTQLWQLEELSEMSGQTFDQDYTELEVGDHLQDIQETEDELAMGCNHAVKDDAAKDLQMLKEHLKLSLQAHQAVGSDDQTGSSSSKTGSKG